RTQCHHGLRLDRGARPAANAVQKDTGTRDRPVPGITWGAPRDPSAVFGVNDRWANGKVGERLSESLLLQSPRVVVALRRVKVCECALRRKCRHQVAQPGDLIPSRSGATHSSVDGEMPWLSRRAPPRDGLAAAQGGRESRTARRVELLGEA